MDKPERETHDFLSVESFSQLPFIRPTSVTPVKEKGIRLFGKDFGGAAGGEANEAESGSAGTNPSEEVKDTSENNGESNRRFECHYCCRNFPTSQALGGHQNAHKRERQHAKRAHLQSAMVQSSLSDSHVYGFMNYRLGSTPTYPSWNNNAGAISVAGNGRFYGSHGSSFSQPPINANTLAFWRIPPAQGNPSYGREQYSLHSLPRFSSEDFRQPQGSGSAEQSRYVYESKASVQDHVSLDLHL